MATDHLRRTNLENKSKQFISEQKKKEAKRDQVLALTLSKAKGEFELDCLAKMGEANELAQSLGETTTYRAYHAAVNWKTLSFILTSFQGWKFEMSCF